VAPVLCHVIGALVVAMLSMTVGQPSATVVVTMMIIGT
jgi:hypothetical protein